MDYQTCYRTLGIKPGSTLKQVHRAYKRLALKHHPDRAPDDPASHDVFIRVTEAYATLRGAFRLNQSSRRGGHCRRCGLLAELLVGLDGGRYCSDCLLGKRRRFLPMPTFTQIRCLAVIVLQGASLYFALSSFWAHDWRHAALAMVLGAVAMLTLSFHLWSADTIER